MQECGAPSAGNILTSMKPLISESQGTGVQEQPRMQEQAGYKFTGLRLDKADMALPYITQWRK